MISKDWCGLAKAMAYEKKTLTKLRQEVAVFIGNDISSSRIGLSKGTEPVQSFCKRVEQSDDCQTYDL